jgi:hypothetical protein
MVQASDINELLADALRDRELEIEAAHERYEKAIEAIKVVQSLLKRRDQVGAKTAAPQPVTESHAETASAPETVAKNGPGISLRQSIRQVLEAHSGSFELDVVMQLLAKYFPGRTFSRNLVSGELYQLKKRGEIKIIKKGIGNLPNTYEKGGTAQNEAA